MSIISSSIQNSNNKYNTTITDFMLDSLNYKYYYNDDFQYITSSEQNKEIIDYVNLFLSKSNSKITIESICDIIKNYKVSGETNKVIIEDNLNIFNITTNTKFKHNQNLLLNNFLSKYQQSRKNPENVPKQLFLNNKQLANMLLSEVNKVNTNKEYSHYIVCNNNDLMNLSIRFVYNNENMEKFNHKHGYNYFEINLKLSDLHPYIPPYVSYIKPKIDVNLVSNILNLSLWNPSLWNYMISLEWIVVNLADALEEHLMKSIDMDDTNFNFIEIKMLELEKGHTDTNIINLNFNKITDDDKSQQNSGFKPGTGYGNGSEQKWDISKYIDVAKTNEINTINILNEINKYIKSNPSTLIPQKLNDYIINKFNGINLLLFNNSIQLYNTLIDSLDLLINNNNDINFDIIDEIKAIVNNEDSSISIDESSMCTYLHYIDVYEKYSKMNIKKQSEKKEETNTDINTSINDYIKMVKENNYNTIKLNNLHRFYNERNLKIPSKTIMRIMAELSSLKKDLPINWDSSVLMRIIPSNTNLISFIIVGPKDTPYHNGLFEFHAYFPDDYPIGVPKVLINTTDNGRVRFNPNLYANGKVCLSLLGTWSGEKGESWIPEISTFFQVIISIQSLILVEEPYFNEPGYERSAHKPEGKKQSAIYNDNIRYETMRVAMLGMLNNKPDSYDKFIEEHFRLKKNEIIDVLNKWYEESLNKEKFKKVYDELIIKLEQLGNV